MLEGMFSKHRVIGRATSYCPECANGYPKKCPRCGGKLHGEEDVDEYRVAYIAEQCQECGSRGLVNKQGRVQ